MELKFIAIATTNDKRTATPPPDDSPICWLQQTSDTRITNLASSVITGPKHISPKIHQARLLRTSISRRRMIVLITYCSYIRTTTCFSSLSRDARMQSKSVRNKDVSTSSFFLLVHMCLLLYMFLFHSSGSSGSSTSGSEWW
eukprot:GHVS01093891.1.p1 GENE.GHVS01093891.1~~GHVS01093891.1.p1  ORF type:complete len:142 (-),score=19.55 GHVS01093891.1:50-475(-)